MKHTQAILTTEPMSAQKRCFKLMMTGNCAIIYLAMSYNT